MFMSKKRFERGVECDVYVSNVSDYKPPSSLVNGTQPPYWIFEVYFSGVRNLKNIYFKLKEIS